MYKFDIASIEVFNSKFLFLPQNLLENGFWTFLVNGLRLQPENFPVIIRAALKQDANINEFPFCFRRQRFSTKDYRCPPPHFIPWYMKYLFSLFNFGWSYFMLIRRSNFFAFFFSFAELISVFMNFMIFFCCFLVFLLCALWLYRIYLLPS